MAYCSSMESERGYQSPSQESVAPKETLEERHHKLLTGLVELQMSYADLVSRIPKDDSETRLPGTSFAEAFESLSQFYMKQGTRKSTEERSEMLKKINAIHDEGGDWKKRLLEVVPIEFSNNERKKDRIGLFTYNPNRARNQEVGGVVPGDPLFELHVEPAYNHPDETLSPESIKKALAQIAVAIVDRFPDTKAVYGKSWLMSHPLAKRLGFMTMNEQMDDNVSSSFWQQFVDKDGKIDQKRADELLRTGQAPFEVKKAMIPIDDFLKKYLPQERRGDLALKEQIPGWHEEFEVPMREEQDVFQRSWSKLNPDTMHEDLLRKMPITMQLIGQAGVEEEFVAILKESAKKDESWDTVMGSKKMESVTETYRKTVNNKRLRERKLHID